MGRLVDKYVKTLVAEDAVADVVECLLFASGKVALEDATVETCLLCVIKNNLVDDKRFIKIVIQIRRSISSQVLNSLNSRLIELNKEGIMLTLFNLAVNNAFTQVSPKEIALPHKYIRQLVVLQQREM